MNTPLLTTERLILRRFAQEDMPALFLLLSDEEVNRFLPWYPVKSLEETRAFYEKRFATAYARPQGYAYAVCLRKDNRPVGYVCVDAEEPHDLGYALCRALWRQGIATEAARAVAARAKEDGLPYLTATHDRNNPGSGCVMQKIGMKYCYSYQELWQPKNFPVIFRMYQLNFACADDFVHRKYWDMYDRHFVETF